MITLVENYVVFEIKSYHLIWVLHFIVIKVHMNEVSENCSLCNKPNDQMLMLSCVHDPCINCAASAFAQQIHIKGRSKEVHPESSRSMSVKSVDKKLFQIIPQSLSSQHLQTQLSKLHQKLRISIKIVQLVLLPKGKKHSILALHLLPQLPPRKKQSIIARNIVRRKSVIIVSLVGPTSVLSAQSMVKSY